MRVKKERLLSILTTVTFILSVISLAFESSVTLIIAATLMAICILLSFIEGGRSNSSRKEIKN